MGCDGGTIPRRDELVKTRKKRPPTDRSVAALNDWRFCNISQQHLAEPIVACRLGRLYNKSALLEALLGDGPRPPHVRTLKDVQQLQLTPNAAYRREDAHSSRFVCPLSGLEMSGSRRFVALWGCGCVFAASALAAVRSGGGCPRCGGGEPVVLNPGEGEREARERLLTRKKRMVQH